MAYFRKRGSTWSYTIDIGRKPDGRRDQKTVSGFKTKKDAQLASAEVLREVEDGTYVKEQDITFEQFVNEWLELYGDNVKESSVRVRRHESNCLVALFDANTKIKDITPRIYQKALTDLKKDGYAENTLAGIHGTGRMIFKKAVELKIRKDDPTQYARIPRVQKTVEELEQETEIPKYLEKEELAVLLRTAREKGLEGDYAIFLTLAYTGIRVGELCALKWTDIDSDEETITITKTYYNPSNNTVKYKLQTPKTGSSKRTIEVDKLVIQELERHRLKQNIIRMKHRETYHDKNFIFTKTEDKFGYPHYIKFVENRMARLLKLSGLSTNLTPHSLRHTHTSLLAEAGVGLEEIMERLGHSDDEITRKVYLHVTRTKKKEAAQKFSELMSCL
ncbi:site-specific integrase [Dendrosporobacter sp. 1207_IL3150]|uniref:site-specific integrase n=1 Tax=Dendrosporobacter sp. 1207_IL3150 TaxID=3084054 RepID=UPI002FDAA2B7